MTMTSKRCTQITILKADWLKKIIQRLIHVKHRQSAASWNWWGAFMITLSTLLGSFGNTLISGPLKNVNAYQILFIKSMYAGIILLSIFLYKNRTIPPDLFAQKKWQFFRIIVGTAGNIFWIYSLQKLAFSNAVTLSMTSSIFTVIGSSIFFSEKIYKSHFLILALGLCGVGLSTQPLGGSFSSYFMFPLFSALLFAISVLLVKKISLHQDGLISTLFIVLGMGFVAFPLAVYQWKALHIHDHFVLLSAGIVYGLVHWTLIQAYTYAHSGFLTPFKFLRFPVGLFIGVFIFNESLKFNTLMGGLLIIISCGLLQYLAKVPSFQWMMKRKLNNKI